MSFSFNSQKMLSNVIVLSGIPVEQLFSIAGKSLGILKDETFYRLMLIRLMLILVVTINT